MLVRGMGAEAAYLSLNRGEGGQNLIGPELGEALGLIRTEELLAARRLDGARQYFTRAYDFGYSKTMEETWEHWPQDSILKDVVRIVRRFRPQIIVSVFSGTPGGRARAAPGGGLGARWRRSPRRATRLAFPSSRGRRGSDPGPRSSSTARPASTAPRPRSLLDGGVLDRGGGEVVPSDRDGGPEPAPVAGHGAAAGDRAIAGARWPWSRTAPPKGSGGLFDGIDTSLAGMPWRDAPGTDGARRAPPFRRPGRQRPHRARHRGVRPDHRAAGPRQARSLASVGRQPRPDALLHAGAGGSAAPHGARSRHRGGPGVRRAGARRPGDRWASRQHRPAGVECRRATP